VALVAEHDAPEFARCAVCRRTILRGELLWDYVTAAGEPRRVCALCRTRAEAAGWMPARLADEPAPPRVTELPPASDDRPVTERALEAFNAGDERRKIAGLRRSLGEPSVAVSEGEDAVTVIVAWELSWYQWEVAIGAGGPSVTEVAKGAEIAEIGSPAPDWNAGADEDGRLRLASR
jgi:hypothetical protein